MTEVMPPNTFMMDFVPLMAIGIGIVLMVAVLRFTVGAIWKAIEHEPLEIDMDKLKASVNENLNRLLVALPAEEVLPGKLIYQDKPKLKNDDLEFEGEDYFEEDEYASFEELLAEKPKRKNDDYD